MTVSTVSCIYIESLEVWYVFCWQFSKRHFYRTQTTHENLHWSYFLVLKHLGPASVKDDISYDMLLPYRQVYLFAKERVLSGWNRRLPANARDKWLQRYEHRTGYPKLSVEILQNIYWEFEVLCLFKKLQFFSSDRISCGGHHAATCSQCPQVLQLFKLLTDPV